MSTAPSTVLPASIPMEQCALSCMMQAPDFAGPVAMDRLRADDFSIETHGILFDLISRQISAGQPTDPVTITSLLYDRNLIEKMGGPGAVSDIYAASPNPGHAPHYVGEVAKKSRRRAFVRGCWDAAAAVMEKCPEEEDFRAVQDELEGIILGIQGGANGSRKGQRSGREVVLSAVDAFKARYAARGKVLGLALGFHDLDRILNGLQPEDFVIVAARPAMGKTALATAFADNIAVGAANQSNVPVLMFTLEMSDQQIMERSLLGRARMLFSKGRTGMFSDAEGAVFRTAREAITAHPKATTDELRNAIAHAAIDHLESFWKYKAEKKGFEITKAKIAEANDQIMELAAAIAANATGQLTFFDGYGVTTATIRAEIRRWVRKIGWDPANRGMCPPLVIIDYIQLVKPSIKKNAGDPRLALNEVCDILKGAAKELGICIMGLAQIGRSAETNKGNLPMMKDIKESGAVEEYADLIMALHRESYYKEWDDLKEDDRGFWETAAKARNNSKPRDILREDYWSAQTFYEAQATVCILKGRNAATGKVEILFHGTQMRFTTKTPALFANNKDNRQGATGTAPDDDDDHTPPTPNPTPDDDLFE